MSVLVHRYGPPDSLDLVKISVSWGNLCSIFLVVAHKL